MQNFEFISLCWKFRARWNGWVRQYSVVFMWLCSVNGFPVYGNAISCEKPNRWSILHHSEWLSPCNSLTLPYPRYVDDILSMLLTVCVCARQSYTLRCCICSTRCRCCHTARHSRTFPIYKRWAFISLFRLESRSAATNPTHWIKIKYCSPSPSAFRWQLLHPFLLDSFRFNYICRFHIKHFFARQLMLFVSNFVLFRILYENQGIIQWQKFIRSICFCYSGSISIISKE